MERQQHSLFCNLHLASQYQHILMAFYCDFLSLYNFYPIQCAEEKMSFLEWIQYFI